MEQKKSSDKQATNLNKVIKNDESQMKDHLGRVVRYTVKETLNKMLDAEADTLCQAGRYERSPNGL